MSLPQALFAPCSTFCLPSRQASYGLGPWTGWATGCWDVPLPHPTPTMAVRPLWVERALWAASAPLGDAMGLAPGSAWKLQRGQEPQHGDSLPPHMPLSHTPWLLMPNQPSHSPTNTSTANAGLGWGSASRAHLAPPPKSMDQPRCPYALQGWLQGICSPFSCTLPPPRRRLMTP